MDQPHRTSFSSTGQTRSCGLCGEKAAYLRTIRDEIAEKYEHKCKNLVVYGAALGEKYEKWMRTRSAMGEHISMVQKRHGHCFFQFVFDTDGKGDFTSDDGSQILIVIDPTRMPYNNHRRNTKILKFSPGLLFPWADRVIWQDAKLLKTFDNNRRNPFGLPSNYILHFNRTVQQFATCASFMGLPHHPNAVDKSPVVSFQAHCDTLTTAYNKRQTLTDDLDAVLYQCKHYQKQHSNLTLHTSRVFHQDALVDSAFIVYDMRSSECQKFNGDLGCSWLDEIHCHSDRDQVSFPHILANSGLSLSPQFDVPGQELRDRVYINQNNVPMLHVAKRSCHWYYRSFSRCVASDEEKMRNQNNNDDSPSVMFPTGLRVAVFVTGTVARFMNDESLGHLIHPKPKKSILVDYYVSMTMAKDDHVQSDITYNSNNITLHSSADIDEYVRKTIGGFTSVGALDIQERIDIDSEPMLKARRKKALQENPNEDPDLRFPSFDIRSEEIGRWTASANRNHLRMHLAIQNLWKSALKWEEEEGFQYDYVIFLGDDQLWLSDFNFYNMVQEDGDVFIPPCDAKDPPLFSAKQPDHALISRRKAAGFFGKYYSMLVQTDVKECMQPLNETLKQGKNRGCNSAMLLKWLCNKHQLKVTKVGHSRLPFRRSVNVKLGNGSSVKCFHKFCPSQVYPLQITNETIVTHSCDDINWNNI